MKLSDLHKKRGLTEAAPPLDEFPEPQVRDPGLPPAPEQEMGAGEEPEEVENFTGDIEEPISPEEVAGTGDLGAGGPPVQGRANPELTMGTLEILPNVIEQIKGIVTQLNKASAAQGADTPLGAKIAGLQKVISDPETNSGVLEVIESSIMTSSEPEMAPEPALAPMPAPEAPMPAPMPEAAPPAPPGAPL